MLLTLIEGLPDDSAYIADVRLKSPPPKTATGVEEPNFRGWTLVAALLADIHDAIKENTTLTGQYKEGKHPKFSPWPRPAKRKPITVAGLRGRYGTR